MLAFFIARTLVFLPTIHTAFAQGNPGGQAGNGDQTSLKLPNPLQVHSIEDLINKLLQGLTLLAIPVVTIMVVLGGFTLITSGSTPAKRTEAKNMIMYAAIGFGILLLADSVALIVKNFFSTP